MEHPLELPVASPDALSQSGNAALGCNFGALFFGHDTLMALRHLSSFIPTADDLLTMDLARLGGILILHLKRYEGLNTVSQNGRLNRDYFIAMLENRNVGLGPLPHKEPEYGAR